MAARSFDVVIAGGGLTGSSLGGVLARSGLGVLVVEKESGFRDRIRGELTFPWGTTRRSVRVSASHSTRSAS
jgi:flavin-dependent dehydrogenase